MKTEFLIIFILSLILNYTKCYVDSSYYSELLGKVREEIVKESFYFLPGKDSINILQMFNKMAEIQEEYSITEIDSAYLIYKWIAKNIELEVNGENDDPTSVYNSGKGTGKGISSLFKKMCDFLKIEAGTISGYLKTIADNNSDELIINIDFAWNYILIDGEYYLIDVSSGAGFLEAYIFYPYYTDFFFGLKPEIFIRHHFPKDNKWQLLSNPYSFETFDSLAYIFYLFYQRGFKTINPDEKLIYVSGIQKVILTVDDSVSLTDIYTKGIRTDLINPYEEAINDGVISDGKIEILYNLRKDNENLNRLSINLYDTQREGAFFPIVFIQLKPFKS